MQEVGVKTSMYLRNSYSNILKCLQTDPRTNKNVWELEYIFQNVTLIFPKEYQISYYRYIRQKLWQSSLHYSGLKRSNLIGLQYAQIQIQSMTSVREDLMIDLYHSLLRIHRGGIDTSTWGCTREWICRQIGKRGVVNLKEISVSIPLGKGEGKAIVKRKGLNYGRNGGRKTRKEGDTITFKILLVLKTIEKGTGGKTF